MKNRDEVMSAVMAGTVSVEKAREIIAKLEKFKEMEFGGKLGNYIAFEGKKTRLYVEELDVIVALLPKVREFIALNNLEVDELLTEEATTPEESIVEELSEAA